MLYAARTLGDDEAPFLYGAVLMSNAGSLFLPGSNLTNLLVLGHGGASGVEFLRVMLPAALAAVVVTGGGILLWSRRLGRAAAPAAAPDEAGAFRPGPGAVGVVVAAVLVVVLREPAIPVAVVGALAAGVALARRELTAADVRHAIGPASIVALLLVAVALGTLAREWDGPARLLGGAGTWGTAGIGGLAAVLVNNLPAATLLSAQPPEHPYALLVGLDLGPNLAVTGSLSSLIWWRTAKRLGATPSALRFSRVGAPLAVISGLVALALL
jgi:arsenical pump membrane protein